MENLDKESWDIIHSLSFAGFLSDLLTEGKLQMNLRGHWENKFSSYLKDRFIERVRFNYLCTGGIGSNYLKQWVDQGFTEQINEYLTLLEPSILLECYHCGEAIGFETDGKTIRATSDCIYPSGIPAFSLHVDIPSGKMVFANDLRYWYNGLLEDKEETDNIDVNKNIGLKLYSEAYEPTGLIICFCGNTCPSIYRLGHNFLAIGNGGYDEDGNEEIDHPGEHVGGVITDLWWWCLADYDNLRNQMSEEDFKKMERHLDIIEIDPGKYEIVQEYHTLKDDYSSNPLTFATIIRTGDI